MISFGTATPEKSAGLFLQLSKISIAGFFICTLLFQQFSVGSEGPTTADFLSEFKDTGTDPDTNPPESVPDTIKGKADSLQIEASQAVDTLRANTNDTGDEVLKFPVKYHARDSMQVDLENEIVYLYGGATVDYEDMHLGAEFISIDMKNKEMFAQGVPDPDGYLVGAPRFSQGNQQFRSNTIRYNFETKKGKIGYVITQEGEGYIHGEIVKKDPENNFFIRNGKYTTCDLDTPHFAITSNKLKVINNNKIVTGPAYLTIESIPTPLLIPFGFFPNKKGRSSGIIFPSFGESAQRGFYFQHLGYYFGFSDYINLALTSDVYTKGSYTLDAASVYKKRYKYSGNVRLSYAYTIEGERELPDFATTKDFHINWTHSQDPRFNPNSTFSANVNAGSQSYYRNTISPVNTFLTNTFQSSVTYSRRFPNKPFNLTLAASHFQNTITKDMRITAPDLSFNVSRISPFKRKNPVGRPKWYEKVGISYSLRGTNYIETKDSLLFRSESLDQLQNGVQHTIPLSTSFNLFNYFMLTPSVNYTERWYFKTTQYAYDADSAKVDTFTVHGFQAARDYQASLGLSTRIYGMYQFRGGPVTAVRHVMTPSVSLSYRPDFGKEKYGYYKTIQTDAAGNTRRYSIFERSVYGGPGAGPFANLGFSLDNNIEMKVRTRSDTGDATKKIKILESLSISSGYNIIADSMNLGVFNVNGRTTLFDRVNLSFGGTLNPYDFDENNNDYDRFLAQENKGLVRLTDANISMSFSLNKTANRETPKYDSEEMEYIAQHPEQYVDFNVPFNLSVSYSYRYSKRGALASTKTQSASFNGDLSLTPQWKIGFNSWYDITEGEFTNVGLNIYRDLHCWEMRLGWIPFGFQESWNFQINVKSSILQDLKLLKKKDFYDR